MTTICGRRRRKPCNDGAPDLIGRCRCEHLILIREDFKVPNAEDLRGIPDLGFADTRQIVTWTNVTGFTAFAARRANDADLHARAERDHRSVKVDSI